MTINNDSAGQKDILFPIENWENAWPFNPGWLSEIFFHMVEWDFPEYDSFLELLVDVFGLNYYSNDYYQVASCKDAITHWPEEINENIINAGLSECFLKNSKLYYS